MIRLFTLSFPVGFLVVWLVLTLLLAVVFLRMERSGSATEEMPAVGAVFLAFVFAGGLSFFVLPILAVPYASISESITESYYLSDHPEIRRDQSCREEAMERLAAPETPYGIDWLDAYAWSASDEIEQSIPPEMVLTKESDDEQSLMKSIPSEMARAKESDDELALMIGRLALKGVNVKPDDLRLQLRQWTVDYEEWNDAVDEYNATCLAERRRNAAQSGWPTDKQGDPVQKIVLWKSDPPPY